MSIVLFYLLGIIVVNVVNCNRIVSNTTVAATNIESTIGTPAFLIDPTTISNSQNTTDTQYETILKITPFSNSTAESETEPSTTLFVNPVNDDMDLTDFMEYIQRNASDPQPGNEKFDESNLSQQYGQAIAKQFALPAAITGLFRSPCECQNGVCGCCTGMLFSALRQLGCLNITYHPEDFSFEFKMLMNNAVLYKNQMSGRNPPPVCARIPRLSFIRMCASFYDLKFVGRNMHICMEMSAFFRENEIFNRSFDCMRIGDKGVKIIRPDGNDDVFHKPGTDAEVDAGFDDIEDYDENAVVRRKKAIGF